MFRRREGCKKNVVEGGDHSPGILSTGCHECGSRHTLLIIPLLKSDQLSRGHAIAYRPLGVDVGSISTFKKDIKQSNAVSQPPPPEATWAKMAKINGIWSKVESFFGVGGMGSVTPSAWCGLKFAEKEPESRFCWNYQQTQLAARMTLILSPQPLSLIL